MFKFLNANLYNNIQAVFINKKFYTKEQAINIMNNYLNLSIDKIFETEEHFRFVQHDSFMHSNYDVIPDSCFIGIDLVVWRKY